MGFFDWLNRKRTVTAHDTVDRSDNQTAAKKKLRAQTAALTERMMNKSLQVIREKHGIQLQQKDVEVLLGIHTDPVLGITRALTQFGSSRIDVLCMYVSQILGQARDILVTPEDAFAKTPEDKLTKGDLVEGMDVVLTTTLLMVGALLKQGVKRPEIAQLVKSLPIEECGPLAKSPLQQVRERV